MEPLRVFEASLRLPTRRLHRAQRNGTVFSFADTSDDRIWNYHQFCNFRRGTETPAFGPKEASLLEAVCDVVMTQNLTDLVFCRALS